MAKKNGNKEAAAVEGNGTGYVHSRHDDAAAPTSVAADAAPAVEVAAPVAAAKPPKPPKVAKEPKPPKEPKPVVVKDTKNGMTRPGAATMIFKIWACSDEVALELGDPALVKKPLVKAKLVAYGETIKDSTIQAQFNYWRKYMGLVTPRAPAAPAAPAAVEGEAAAA